MHRLKSLAPLGAALTAMLVLYAGVSEAALGVGVEGGTLPLTKALGDLPECPVAEQAEAGELADRGCTPHSILGVIANGHDGNPPSNTLDDRLDTRWSQFGKGAWIDYDLGSDRPISGAAIAWHAGNTRTNAFMLSVSSDGRMYTPICKGTSSGTTTAAELLAFAPRTARRLRITVQGNSKNDWASIAEARVCADSKNTLPSPPASVEWRGDFETGDHSQWHRKEWVGTDRLRVVSSPVREGRFALAVTVKQGDDPINASGNRNELVRRTLEPEGSEYAYRWSTRFAPGFPSVNHWQLFTQWHHEGSSGSPPVEFYVLGEELQLRVGGTTGSIVWRAPLVRDVWHDFAFHVKWSPDPKVGFVELYHNGKLVLPKRFIATQYPGQRNYLKMGLYRDERVAPAGVLYHDGFNMARRLEEVPPAEALSTAEAASTPVP